jgi:hypothetical protein
MKEIYIVVTMDVEPALPIDRPNGSSGPLNYEDSERFILGYVAMAAKYGFPVSFMIHPEVASKHLSLFKKLEIEGACLGLHLHPWKFANGRYKAHFGGLTRQQQISILNEASDMWSAALKRRPLWFRPGTFSANDETLPVLEELGFAGGSISLPGRVYPDMCAIWAGAPFDPHFGHNTFRQLPGELSFVNIPLSVDMSGIENRDGNLFNWDLRPDWQSADYLTIADNIVGQVVKRNPAVPVVHMVTHNDNDFMDPNDRVAKNFSTVLNEVTEACQRRGLKPIGSTFSDVAERLRETGSQKQIFRHAHASMLNG